ncbi:dihydrofolate reductase [Bacillus sp. M6-12]|uniref:dihydrofolate reductase n=1 Tax=Bacillus sp. M6-12 TaxID=2054166 RepID=UPI000C78F6A4|nr:dihydrofolate reductase [Bacillus sp. M6-12]PLS18871.1 dihydrofolate reductase [Bacillus sp. M6-12]
MSLSIVVAMSKNHVIGKDNQLLWHLPSDLKEFKKITTGHTIIMGRKTFESLPSILPERHHIVLTKNKEYQIDHEQVTVVHAIGELLSLIEWDKQYFVIGGGEIYKMLLPLCETIYVTKIHQEFTGDTVFPVLNLSEWDILKEEEGIMDEKNTLPHTFMTLQRKTT